MGKTNKKGVVWGLGLSSGGSRVVKKERKRKEMKRMKKQAKTTNQA